MSQLDPRTKRYTVIKNRLALSEPIILFIFLIIMQASGISLWIKYISINLSTISYGIIAIYAVLLGLFYYLVTFYLRFYRSYVVEHRFNLSHQTLIDWIKDELKRVILSLILFLLFTEFLYLLLYNSPRTWWLFMALGWISLTIVLAKLGPIFLIPLFFKYEEIDDNELRERLTRLSKICDIKILDIFKLKTSLKTKKANAALVGVGRTRRVLLGDTLLENYTKDEIEVVLAHELAHHKLAHMWKLIIFGGLGTLIAFYLVSATSNVLFANPEKIKDIVLFPSIMFLLIFFFTLINPIQNAFSRRLEGSADLLCLRITKLPQAFISCMNKLAKQNLSDPAPSKFIEIMLYDHPPIQKRIRMAETFFC